MPDPSPVADSAQKPEIASRCGPDLPLAEQLRHENRFLFETLSRLFEFQREILRRREEAGPAGARSTVERYLGSSLGVTLLVLLEGPTEDSLVEVYRWVRRGGPGGEDPPFSSRELRTALTKDAPLVKPPPPDVPQRPDRPGPSTTILLPLAQEGPTLRVATLRLEDAPADLEGFKLEILRFLLMELSAARREIAFGNPGADLELAHMRKLEALRSDTILGLIHDMKTPLTGILSGCELLLVDPSGLSTDQRETLDIIHVSASRLQSLAGDLLELGSMKTAVADEPMEMQDLVTLLERITSSFSLQAGKHEISFETEEESLVLLCQRKRLARLVENLIGNAVKYSPRGGKVWIRLSRENDEARLSVKDEGIGIEPGEIDSIWDRYHRSNNPEEIEGTGLGLSIIKMIVDRHRGRVTVDSVKGQGTTFTVYLPIVTSDQPVA